MKFVKSSSENVVKPKLGDLYWYKDGESECTILICTQEPLPLCDSYAEIYAWEGQVLILASDYYLTGWGGQVADWSFHVGEWRKLS